MLLAMTPVRMTVMIIMTETGLNCGCLTRCVTAMNVMRLVRTVPSGGSRLGPLRLARASSRCGPGQWATSYVTIVASMMVMTSLFRVLVSKCLCCWTTRLKVVVTGSVRILSRLTMPVVIMTILGTRLEVPARLSLRLVVVVEVKQETVRTKVVDVNVASTCSRLTGWCSSWGTMLVLTMMALALGLWRRVLWWGAAAVLFRAIGLAARGLDLRFVVRLVLESLVLLDLGGGVNVLLVGAVRGPGGVGWLLPGLAGGGVNVLPGLVLAGWAGGVKVVLVLSCGLVIGGLSWVADRRRPAMLGRGRLRSLRCKAGRVEALLCLLVDWSGMLGLGSLELLPAITVRR